MGDGDNRNGSLLLSAISITLIALGAVSEDECGAAATWSIVVGSLHLIGALGLVVIVAIGYAVGDETGAGAMTLLFFIALTGISCYAAYASFNEHDDCHGGYWKAMGALNVIIAIVNCLLLLLRCCASAVADE